MPADEHVHVHVVKAFRGGRKSLSVRLLSTGVVEKRYDPRRPRHVSRFHKEVALLRHLQGCPFVPTLVAVDADRLMFKVSYCGTPAPDTPDTRAVIDKVLRAIERDFGVVRRQNLGKPKNNPHELGTLSNATVLNGQLYIVDWGSSQWIRCSRQKSGQK